jgi:hypothetical protein
MNGVKLLEFSPDHYLRGTLAPEIFDIFALADTCELWSSSAAVSGSLYFVILEADLWCNISF